MSKTSIVDSNVKDRLLPGLLAFLLVLPLPAFASEKPAAYWLEQLGPSLNTTSYRGVFVYARGTNVHSMQIAHRYRNGTVDERLVFQDGGSGEIVRRDMNVVCVLPEQGTVKLDQVIPSGPFAEAYAQQLMPASRWYQTELKGEGRVAGYNVIAVALTAKDDLRYSHRLWLEKSTGLLVKSHVRSARGDVLEHFQFTSLEITDDIPDSEFEVRTEGREVSRTLDQNGQHAIPAHQGDSPDSFSAVTRTQGWHLGWRPEGFEPAVAPRSSQGKAIAFSDGLAAFSVFVEPAGRVNMPTGASHIGATTIYMRQLQVDDKMFLITVVGEVPLKVARQVAESVQVNEDFVLSTSQK